MATAVGIPLGRTVAAERAPPARAAWRAPALRLVLGSGLLLGQWAFVFGAAWDIQWHVAVGRDRPLTPPHLLLLAGIALTGLVALAAVLGFTAAGRTAAGRAALPAVRFLRIFRAPLGVYVAGFGALLSAIAFPLDDYWHRLYGIDVTLWSAFHVMIVAGMALAALGTTYVFAPLANGDERDERRTTSYEENASEGWLSRFVVRLTSFVSRIRRRWPQIAASLGVAFGLAAIAATLLLLQAQALDKDGVIGVRPRPFVVFPWLVVALTLPWLAAAAPALRLPGGATLMALGFVLVRQALFWFIPWAVALAATIERLPLRPGAPSFAATPTAYPVWIVVAGVLVDAAWWLLRTRRLRLPAVPTLVAAGTVAGLIVAVLDRPWVSTLPLTRAGRGLDVHAALWTSLPAVVVCGLVAAVVGVGLGAALRRVRA